MTTAVCIEASSNPLIVEAEQLIDLNPIGLSREGVSVRGETSIPLDKTEVVARTIHPEACRIPIVVDRYNLGLDRTREVLIAKILLTIRREEGITFVRAQF